jgi:hypothetical protein
MYDIDALLLDQSPDLARCSEGRETVNVSNRQEMDWNPVSFEQGESFLAAGKRNNPAAVLISWQQPR